MGRGDAIDLRIGLIENMQCSPRRLIVTLGGLLVRDGLFEIARCIGLHLSHALGAFQRLGGLRTRSGGAHQSGFGLGEVGAVDREKNLAARDVVPGLGKHFAYPS